MLVLVKDLDLGGPERGAIRDRLADWYVESEGVRLTHARLLTALSRGKVPGPEASISKVVMASQRQELSSFGADLQEMAAFSPLRVVLLRRACSNSAT